MKDEQHELEEKLKRLQLANRMLDLVFSIVGIAFIITLLYILKNA